MPSSRAASNSGCVSGPGISRSKNASISACSSMYQRGKKVVSASSGNTTRSQPWRVRLAQQREQALDHAARALSLRAIGPSCAAPTVTMRVMAVGCSSGRQLEQRVQQHVGAGREVRGRGVLGRVVADAA